MGFEIKLKTGFFETKEYDLLISKNKLILSSAEGEDQVITIFDKDIIAVSLKNEKLAEIEINTWDRIYRGVLCSKPEFEDLLRMLKENLNRKIICEFGGGKDHA